MKDPHKFWSQKKQIQKFKEKKTTLPSLSTTSIERNSTYQMSRNHSLVNFGKRFIKKKELQSNYEKHKKPLMRWKKTSEKIPTL